MLQTISLNATLYINSSKKITLDLNGYDLNISISTSTNGTALDIGQGGSLTTTGSGALNASGYIYGIYAHEGALVNVTGDISATGGYSSSYGSATGLYAYKSSDPTVSVTVHGNVSGYIGAGVYSGAFVTVYGSVSGENYAAYAGNGGTLTISGNATGQGPGSVPCISAHTNAVVHIGGNVQATDSNGNGISADEASTVTVSGSVSAGVAGVAAAGGSTVQVDGSVTTVTDNGIGYVAIANESSNIKIGGDVRTGTTGGAGVNAYQGGKVTIDGIIQADKDMIFGESDGALVTPTTKTGYRTYSDGADPSSYVWLKETASLPPTVTTNPVDSDKVTTTSAYVSGVVNTHGTTTETVHGFVYGLNANPEIGGVGVTKLPFGSGVTLTNNVYDQTISSLSPGTTYHVRAYATNDGATVYGEDRSFATEIDITSLPDSKTIYVDGRLTLTPSPSGGTWQWDKTYVKLTAGSGSAEVKGLKAGTTTVTYTVGGSSKSVTVVIKASELPATGQDFTWVWVLAALAVCAGVAMVMLKKHAAKAVK